MSLHDIVEPAGTLVTGWKLVPEAGQKADIRNKDAGPPPPADGDQDAPAPKAPPSKWELRKVR